MEDFLELIGQIIDEAGLEKEDISFLSEHIEAYSNSYTLVTWPNSQELMNEDWFGNEAILDTEMKFGISTYFVPTKRIKL